MAYTVYLTHHSHCDLGYTHDLPIVHELQRRYIDEALDLADQYADRGDAATFRWTCEVTSIVEHWLTTASPAQVTRFLAAAQRGQIEVCALWCNLTPLATLSQLAEMLAPLRRLRSELGLSVRAAMNSDVNGFSSALAEMLAQSGIEGLTMSINEHFGKAPQPFPGLFRWGTPSGKFLPVWSGPTYAHTAWMGLGGDFDTAQHHLQSFIKHRKESGWEHPWLYMQYTHPGPQNDNMGPVAHLSPWIEEFNKRHGDTVRLVVTTPSRFFDAIKPEIEAAPAVLGEWNDWWSFGVGSTPYETALFRQGTSRLEEGDLLALLQPSKNFTDLRLRARDAFGHYIEHTWGADCSVHQFASDDARIQGRHKERFAYDAFSLARLMRRDGLSALADRVVGPEGPAMVLFNPTPFARSESVRIPRRFVEASNLPPQADPTAPRRWPRDGAYQQFVDRELFGGTPIDELGPFDLPPFGWKIVTAADQAAPAEKLRFAGNSAENGAITLAWKPGAFGLDRIETAGHSWVGESPAPFGTMICEEVLGDHGTMMRFDDSLVPATTRRPIWNPSPALARHLPTEVTTKLERTVRALHIVQAGKLPFTDGVSVRWILSADHNDIEAEITIKKLPEARPHSLYFALPFALPEARNLVATAGLLVEPENETIPNGCPWWSAQEGFLVGDKTRSVAVAAPDAPMLGFRKLPLGVSQVNGSALEGRGLAWIWLYNNYWETNFKADASGTLRYKVRLSFSDKAFAPANLARISSAARHPIAYHPLPISTPTPPAWPAEGQLFEIKTGAAQLNGCFFEPETNTVRLAITNPSRTPEDFVLSSRYLPITAAEIVTPEGIVQEQLTVKDGGIKANVPARDFVFLRIATK